jgi:excisionase family DNA binding protein
MSPALGDLRLSITLSTEQIDLIADRVAGLLDRRSLPDEPDGFLDVTGAAEFLACPRSRIYALVSKNRIPHHKDGSRLLFDRGELRQYVRNGGARRP